jgi:hypothetical protein
MEDGHEASRSPWPRRLDPGGRHAVAGVGPRRDPEAWRHDHPPSLGPAALRSVSAGLVQDAHRVLVHPQPARQAQGRPRRGPRHVRDRGRPGRVVEPAGRDHVRLQAPSRRALAAEGAGERARAHRRGRRLQRGALPHDQGQRQRLDAQAPGPGGGDRPPHRALHDEGALCVVPRRARQPDGRMHRGEGMCREVRRPAEPRGDRRNGPVDARFVPAQCRHDAGAQPGLLRGGPALHRQGRDLRGRGQCLAHGRIPRRQVRHRLGESRDDQSQ